MENNLLRKSEDLEASQIEVVELSSQVRNLTDSVNNFGDMETRLNNSINECEQLKQQLTQEK